MSTPALIVCDGVDGEPCGRIAAIVASEKVDNENRYQIECPSCGEREQIVTIEGI